MVYKKFEFCRVLGFGDGMGLDERVVWENVIWFGKQRKLVSLEEAYGVGWLPWIVKLS